MVKWLLQLAHEHGWKWMVNEWTCVAAAQAGHVQILKLLRENGCGWNKWVCLTAARNGHLEVLKWAWENGAPWHLKNCAEKQICFTSIGAPPYTMPIALSGHLEVLRFAIEKGGNFHRYTCRFAAERRDLEMLQWAREHGAPWDEEVCDIAASNQDLKMLKWAREQGCPWFPFHSLQLVQQFWVSLARRHCVDDIALALCGS